MLTPTPVLGRALRRLALTTKQAGKDYYKGTGSGAMGAHTKWGGYKVDPNKVRTYKVPDMTDFPVRLFSPASSLAFPPKSPLHSSAHPPSPPPMRASLRLSSIQSENTPSADHAHTHPAHAFCRQECQIQDGQGQVFQFFAHGRGELPGSLEGRGWYFMRGIKQEERNKKKRKKRKNTPPLPSPNKS